jgi:hypothetical protein
MNYRFAQVYKTGEKYWDKPNLRGRKPLGWNVYKQVDGNWFYEMFVQNSKNCYLLEEAIL